MVPEPHNPFDGRAVDLDIDGRSVGNLRASAAWMWHDIVRSCNQGGLAVWLRSAWIAWCGDWLEQMAQKPDWWSRDWEDWSDGTCDGRGVLGGQAAQIRHEPGQTKV